MKKKISLLDEGYLAEIYAASLRLLEKVGLEVYEPELCTLLKRAGARVGPDDRTVRLPSNMVTEALDQAPKGFEVYGRDKSILTFPTSETYLMSRGKMPFIFDGEHLLVRTPSLEDIGSLARLNQALPSIDLIYIVDCPTDGIPSEKNWICTAQSIYSNVLKPLVIAPIHLESAVTWVEMGEVATGTSMLSMPTVIMTASTTALKLDHDTAQALIYSVRKGLPVLTLPIPMAGAVAPFTLAGTLLAQNVEALFLITATQAIRPSAPVIYGGIGHVMNMREGRISFGSPELPLCNSGITALGHWYGLPAYNATGYTDSALPDFQAGAEKTLSIYNTLLSGTDMALVGTLDNSKSTSGEVVVMDHDLWEAAERATREIEVNRDTLAEDVIEKLGPGGVYIGEPHTLQWLRSGEHYYGGTFNRQGGLDEAKTMFARARDRARFLSGRASMVPEDMIKRIEDFARQFTSTPV
jgi:trimethylamine--corrinoid protein Co-methyltransferase